MSGVSTWVVVVAVDSPTKTHPNRTSETFALCASVKIAMQEAERQIEHFLKKGKSIRYVTIGLKKRGLSSS